MSDLKKKQLNIVTTLCVDQNDNSLNYQLFHLNNRQKRLTYWKCCLTFFGTSIRCNPDANHILYTNDKNRVTFNGIDLKKFLSDIGVEIRYLPFTQFLPPSNLSRYLMLAYYELDALKDLSKNNDDNYSIVLDSDCVWTKPDDRLNQLINSDKLLLFDVYNRTDPFDKGPHNFSRKDMGDLFKEVDKEYLKEDPIWFGGEIIAGSNKNLKIISDGFKSTFDNIIQSSNDPRQFSISRKMLERGMEFLTSFVLNKSEIGWNDANGFIKRIWTLKKINNVSPSDTNLTIWHLIGEKMLGIPLLGKEVLNRDSEFWKIPLDRFNIYLGEYLGVPERKYEIKEPGFFKIFIPKLKSKVKQVIYKLS